MRLKAIEIAGFKSFAKKSALSFDTAVTAVVGPNGSGKSNVVEAFRFVLGEQSMKSMRGKTGADLIFRGSSGASKLSRASVSIMFDNSDGVFAFPLQTGEDTSKAPVLFDTITFTRELYADGTSKYLMNGTEVRLKTMIELLSSVNIGASSHHIISQGEADSILRVNSRDRREMLEEALGLKVYHYRIKESESKLAKSTDTLKEVQSLRRELAPHLSFLKKQVEKIEKGKTIRAELEGVLLQYLATERSHLEQEDIRIREAIRLIEHKKQDLENALVDLPQEQVGNYAADIAKERASLATLRDTRRQIESRIGRLEGMIEVERRLIHERPTTQGESVTFAPTEYTQLLNDLSFFIQTLEGADSLDTVRTALVRIAPLIQSLRSRQPQSPTEQSAAPRTNDALADIAVELEDLQKDLTQIIQQESLSQETLVTLESKRDEHSAHQQSAVAARYRIQGELVECNAELHILTSSHTSFLERKSYFDTELREAAFIFGPQFLHTLKATLPTPELNLHDIKRTIDRLKIRLDEHAGIGHEVVGEYESTIERDAFLAREVADIENSIRNLETLIIDLKKVLDEKFTDGVTVINERFGEFFKTMFGGGSAFLSITAEKRRKRKGDDEDIDTGEGEETDDRFMERGIEVHVSLPEKKVKELTMLSGGERSLVSIALLFAISQVNPPPFLVLDETDAALDEANSRRYGDMVERLSEYSQLIVVTHNRETMSRASVLYGVTLGSDGSSKLLSIKFDEAVKVAK
jgi:chromosome segregation ATPase